MKKIRCPCCSRKLEPSKCRSHVKDKIAVLSDQIREIWKKEMENAEELDRAERELRENEEYLIAQKVWVGDSNPRVAKSAKEAVEWAERAITNRELVIETCKTEDMKLKKKRRKLEREMTKLQSWTS